MLEPKLLRLQASEEYAGDYDHTQNAIFTHLKVYFVTNWAFTDWNGNEHGFRNVSWCNWYLGAGSTQKIQVTESKDGSFYRLDTTNATDVKVTAKDGTVYQ